MRISGAAIFARSSSPADAVQPLVDDYAIPYAQVTCLASNFGDCSGDFMTQDLRLNSERDRKAAFIRVVVGVSGKYVRVSAAKADR
jgi:hypothetical protein